MAVASGMSNSPLQDTESLETPASPGELLIIYAIPQLETVPRFPLLLLSSNMDEDQRKLLSLLSQSRLLLQRRVWRSAEGWSHASRISHKKAFHSGGLHGLLPIFLYYRRGKTYRPDNK